MRLDRIRTQDHAEAIAASLGQLPARLAERLAHVRFVCGVDPVFAGLHDYTDTGHGRTYAETPHYCSPHHLARAPTVERIPTVVLPTPVEPYVVTHELGHALDDLTGHEHAVAPVTAHAETNRREAFAEAFTAWLHPDVYPWAPPLLAGEAVVHLFEELAR